MQNCKCQRPDECAEEPARKPQPPLQINTVQFRSSPAEVLDSVALGRVVEVSIHGACARDVSRYDSQHVAVVLPVARYQQLLSVEEAVRQMAAIVR